MTQFYTYLYLRQDDGIPYYVGKGKGRRAYHKYNRIINRPESDHLIIVQHWESEEKAFDMEKWWIALWGRKNKGTGSLRNFTDGGEGTSGRPSGMRGKKHSEETKNKMSKRQKGRKTSEETKAKQSEATKRRAPISKETREKLRVSHLGIKPSKKSLVKRTESRKGYRHSKQAKEKLSDKAWQQHHIKIV